MRLFSFDILDIPGPSDNMISSFNKLEDDKYLKEKYCFRKRAYTKATFFAEENRIEKEESNTFYQDERVNHYAGGINRIYKPIDNSVFLYSMNVVKIVASKYEVLGKQTEIGIHQIRICTEGENLGFPVPEGYHQDGFDYVIILPIQSFNINGGMNSVRFGSAEGPEFLEKELQSSQALVLNDKTMFHYASPIIAIDRDLVGYRDSIIITLWRKKDV